MFYLKKILRENLVNKLLIKYILLDIVRYYNIFLDIVRYYDIIYDTLFIISFSSHSTCTETPTSSTFLSFSFHWSSSLSSTRELEPFLICLFSLLQQIGLEVNTELPSLIESPSLPCKSIPILQFFSFSNFGSSLLAKLKVGSYSHYVNLYSSPLGCELGCLTVKSHIC